MTRLVRPKIHSRTAPSRHGFHNRDLPIRNPVVEARPSDRVPTPSCPARPSSRPSRSHLDRADRAPFPPALAVAPTARESGAADTSAVRHRRSRPVVVPAPDKLPRRADVHRPGVDKLAWLRSQSATQRWRMKVFSRIVLSGNVKAVIVGFLSSNVGQNASTYQQSVNPVSKRKQSSAVAVGTVSVVSQFDGPIFMIVSTDEFLPQSAYID